MTSMLPDQLVCAALALGESSSGGGCLAAGRGHGGGLVGRRAAAGGAGRGGWRFAGPGAGPEPGLDLDAAGDEIRRGGDPLGAAFCALRDPARRRPLGQTFTPPAVIESMISWAAGTGCGPARVGRPRFRIGPVPHRGRSPVARGQPGRGGDRPGGRDHRPGQPGRGRAGRTVPDHPRRLPRRGPPARPRPDPVPGQPALRPASPDRAGMEGLAAPRGGWAGPAGQRAGRAARHTSSWPPRGTRSQGISAR